LTQDDFSCTIISGVAKYAISNLKEVEILSDKHFLKLRGAVAEKGKNLGSLAEELAITPQALSNKLANRTPFTLWEMVQTCNFLDAQIAIFFDPKLHNLQFLEQNKTA